MDWNNILTNVAGGVLRPPDHSRVRARRDRPQHPLRPHGPHQHGPGRLHAAGGPTGSRSRRSRAGRCGPPCSSPSRAPRSSAHPRHPPTLKLRGGDYLAIVTIAAAEIVRLIGRSTALTELTGASSGLRGGNDYKHTFQDSSPFGDGNFQLGPFDYSMSASNSWWVRIVGWTVVGLACLLVWLLIRSPWGGRVLKGIREDEDAVRSLGKNVYSYKMQRSSSAGASVRWRASSTSCHAPCSPTRWAGP